MRPASAPYLSNQQSSQSIPVLTSATSKVNNSSSSNQQLTAITTPTNNKNSNINGGNSNLVTLQTQKAQASTAPVTDMPLFDSTNFSSNTVHINRYHSSININKNSSTISSFHPLSGGVTTGGKFNWSPLQIRLKYPQIKGNIYRHPTVHHPALERSNPVKRLAPEENFKFPAKPSDRDELRRQQDSKIGAFRSRHPELYEPPHDSPKSPHLQQQACHHDVTNRITPRDRTVAGSNRAHCHDPLPFYPFLRENEDHGVHKVRWSVLSNRQTIPRYRPETIGLVTKIL